MTRVSAVRDQAGVRHDSPTYTAGRTSGSDALQTGQRAACLIPYDCTHAAARQKSLHPHLGLTGMEATNEETRGTCGRLISAYLAHERITHSSQLAAEQLLAQKGGHQLQIHACVHCTKQDFTANVRFLVMPRVGFLSRAPCLHCLAYTPPLPSISEDAAAPCCEARQ